MNSLLIISSQAPYYSCCAQDALESALAASNVGVHVTYVFSQNGIYQLIPEQKSVSIGKKSLFKQIKALPLYDIESLFYIKEDAKTLGVSMPDLNDAVRPMESNSFIESLDSFDAVLRF